MVSMEMGSTGHLMVACLLLRYHRAFHRLRPLPVPAMSRKGMAVWLEGRRAGGWWNGGLRNILPTGCGYVLLERVRGPCWSFM